MKNGDGSAWIYNFFTRHGVRHHRIVSDNDHFGSGGNR